MSEFKVEIVRIGPVEKLPNSDRLEYTLVHGGYPCITGAGNFKQGDLAVYLPVDAMVPASHPAFAFLVPPPERKPDTTEVEFQSRTAKYERERAGKVRIKAKKLRGTFSMGLLVPVKEAFPDDYIFRFEGTDVQAALGVEKYEPDESNRKGSPGGSIRAGEQIKCPFYFPVYTDIEGLRKYGKILEEGEEVVIVEKLHGANSRFVWKNDELWVGSHYQIKREPHTVTAEERRIFAKAFTSFRRRDWFYRWGGRFFGMTKPMEPLEPRDVPSSDWWNVATTLQLKAKLSMIPDLVVFGEVYGRVQFLNYDKPGDLGFRAFDAFDLTTNQYLDYDDFARKMLLIDIETCPLLYRGPWSDSLRSLAEGNTTIQGATCIREGFVVRPVKERLHDRLGRVILKLVGEKYLLAK